MSFLARVRYRERQPLRAADLQAEQDYLLGVDGRHNLGPHDWGIVRGLALTLAGNELTVHPGLAVDGYGREIAVFQPVRITLDAPPYGKYVYLFVCPRPQGGCGDKPNTRWRDTAQVILSDELPAPDTEPDLATARAAGLACDTPPWPILLGQFVQPLTDPHADLSNVRSTRVKAAQIVAPSGSSLVKIGTQGLGDPYQFRIASRVSGALTDRLTIDRDNNVTFWGDLIVTGSALAPVVLEVSGEILKITARPTAGAQIRWRSFADETGSNFILEFRDVFKQRDVLALPVGSSRVPDVVKRFNETSRLVTVVHTRRNAGNNIPITSPSHDITSPPAPIFLFAAIVIPFVEGQTRSTRAAVHATVQAVDNHDTDFRYESPTIVFEAEKPNAKPTFCGCSDSDEKLPVLPNGISFQAGAVPPKVAARDIYAIKVGQGEQQHEQLRAAIGTFEEGDLGRRFSVGSMRTDSQGPHFNPWLLVRGNGAVELPGGQVDGSGLPFTMIDVKGTLKLPVIKPDPRDPVFKSLLVLTFLTGVLSHGPSPVLVEVVNPPTFVETGQDFVYTIRVTNKDLVLDLKNIEGTDRFIGQVGTNQLNLPTAAIAHQSNTSYQITHHPIDFQNLSELSVDIFVVGNLENRKAGGKATISPIPVIKSPFIDLTMILPEVPAGWSVPISVENLAERDLTITSNLTAKNLGADQSLQPDSTQLHALEMTSTTPLQIPRDLSGSKNLEVEMKYRFNGQASDQTITARQAVLITKLLDATTVATPVAGSAWTFDLKLTNISGLVVRLKELKVTVTAPNETPKVFQFSFPGLGQRIGNGQTFTQAALDGIIAPTGTNVTVDLEMLLRYRLTDWDPVVDTLPPIIIP